MLNFDWIQPAFEQKRKNAYFLEKTKKMEKF